MNMYIKSIMIFYMKNIPKRRNYNEWCNKKYGFCVC